MRHIYFQRTIETVRDRLHAFLSLGTLNPLASLISSDDETLLADVEAVMACNGYGAKFSHIVEGRFKRATAEPRGKLFVRTALLGLVIYNLFLVVDWFVVPDVMWLAVPLQLGVMTPITIMFIVAIFRFRIDPEIPTLICLFGMLAATIVMYATSRSPHVNLFACIFGLFLVSGNVALALSFEYALVFSTISVVAVSAAILLHPMMDVPDQVLSIALLLAFSTYSLGGNYRIEAGVRTAYLFALREGLRAKLLDISNKTLKSLVMVDGLTGVGNRRLFDENLKARWQDLENVSSIGLLLIDIDCFKKFNDDHGHLAGDECLRCVAKVLANAASGTPTTLARYGGEEFAIVTANTTLWDVAAFAERLRTDVERLFIQVEGGGEFRVTISVGCAAVVPSNVNTPAELIGAADAALYLAKRSGRNRVEIAKLAPSSPAYDQTAAPADHEPPWMKAGSLIR